MTNKTIQQAFHQISTLIRTSPPVDEEGNKIHVSDGVKLKLYGYYKCAISDYVNGTPRPSIFDPVGRAKYDAWVQCSQECEDVEQAMRRYVEVAAGQDGSLVGRECGSIYREMCKRLESEEVGGEANSVGDDLQKKTKTAQTAEIQMGQELNQQVATSSTKNLTCETQPQKQRVLSINKPKRRWYSLASFLPTLIPRGQLDISIFDLLFALFTCLQHSIFFFFFGPVHNLLSKILPSFVMTLLSFVFGRCHPEQMGECHKREIVKWAQSIDSYKQTKQAPGEETQVVVGLSVRSLLDLYFLARSFPAGSEVVLVPGISIQGMVDVMEHHDLILVPVDLPSREMESRDAESNSDEAEVTNATNSFELCSKAAWGIDMQAIKAAVSKKTVAIMVVHPFGAQIADEAIMKQLRDVANEHSLEIWEDCAQCFAAKSLGSRFANASFFSFGPIKTSTALGGGLAVLRNTATISLTHNQSPSFNAMQYSESMEQIQEGMYTQQSNFSFLGKVLKCMMVHILSHSQIACGSAKILIQFLGWDYDDFVVSSLRGFSAGNIPGMECSLRRRELMKQLRRRPCPALLGLLRRRLIKSQVTMRRIIARNNQCRALEQRLINDLQLPGKVVIPRSLCGSGMHGWIFPILVKDPQHTRKALLDRGIDAPCGLTQLKPISNEQCPKMRAVFDHVLYLPVTSDNSYEDDQHRMINALKDDDVTKTKVLQSERRRDFQVWRHHPLLMVLAILLQWYFGDAKHNYSVTKIVYCTVALTRWILIAAAFVALFSALLSRYMGPIYLKSSNTFSKYCDMLFQSPFDADCTKEKSGTASFMQSKSVLKLDSTEIPKIEPHQNIFPMCLVTGASGFIGSLLLRELLLHRDSLGVGGVVVIVRSKRGKSARERINGLLTQSMFDFLNEDEKSSIVHVIEGDVTLPDCGLTQQELSSLCELNISHVFHCAAAVSFSQPLEDAAMSNITSSLQMQRLTKCLKSTGKGTAKFVYISTAFVHGGNPGTKSKPLPESLFSLGPYDPLELYKSMLGTQSYASAAMNELGFPNSYTFSKCICEHLLLADSSVVTLIVRPSIVGPSVQEPYEGWAGEKPSTIVAAACLYLKFPYNMWCFGKEIVPFVPADVVCRFVISRAFRSCEKSREDNEALAFAEEKKEMSPCESNSESVPVNQKSIMTVAWDASSSTTSSFSWVSYAYAITHLGSVCGHVNRVVAYAGLLLSTKIFPWFNFQYATFQGLHSFFVRVPVDMLLNICDIKSSFGRDLKALSPILDLPMLFFPFANQNFYFKSDLVAPSDFNGERYMFSCAIAAHQFISQIKKRRSKGQSDRSNVKVCPKHATTSLVIAGLNHNKPVSDLFWAITQPNGSLIIRLGGWILAKIFRYTAMEIEIDAASFVALARFNADSRTSSRPSVIIAPTHRSFYDFLIISYICFSYPELGIEVPFIAAADDFRTIPIIGWLARGAQAFFLKRGRTKADPGLRSDLDRITKNSCSSTYIEVFIEGRRSRHRTFSPPKTGFLKCLAETEQNYVILPVTINYEALPDETSLIEQANYGHRSHMSLTSLMHWLYRAFSGSVSIGHVFVSASGVLDMPGSVTTSALCKEIQHHHQKRVTVTNYHIGAASMCLGIPKEVIVQALADLGVTVLPELSDTSCSLSSPQLRDLQWAGLLHFSHNFTPFLTVSHPLWSSWLSPSGSGVVVSDASEAVKTIVATLAEHFEAAEEAVANVISNLEANGFPNPDEMHITQYLPQNTNRPLFLMRVAAQMKMASSNSRMVNTTLNAAPIFQRVDASSNPHSESLGAWGYQDSYFVLNVGPDGSKHVVMKGKRYGISGKKLPRLATFVETELNIKINPNDVTFPAVENLQHIPATALNNDDLSVIAAVFGSGMGQVSIKPLDRARHGTGHTQEDMYGLRSGSLRSRLPDVIVRPKSEDEVKSLISLATDKNYCLIPFGGGTNVTHATHCPEKSDDPRPMISVDMKSMNRVVWVNKEDGLAHVEAGITGRQLIEHMEKLGFTIGHEPDSYEFSTLGGWIATKASGMKQNRYGNIEDIVKEVNVAGANGLVSNVHSAKETSFGRVSTGVDFKSIMLGSEGCLGIITSAVIKIWPIAEATSYESVLLPDFDAGLRFAKAISKMRTMKPASVRLLDNDQFRLGQALKPESSRLEQLKNAVSKQFGYYYGRLSEKTVVCATITFEGSVLEVQMQKKGLRDIAASHCGILAGPAVGKAGYDLTFAIAYLRDFALNYRILGESFESFVPWSKLKHVIEATKQRILYEHRSRSLPGVPFVCSRITQLYDEGACVYFYFCMDISGIPNPSTTFATIEECARQAILHAGGSLSHHHGVGKLRAPFVRQIYSDGYMNSLIAVKKALDPDNVFGVGNGVLANHTPCDKDSGMK